MTFVVVSSQTNKYHLQGNIDSQKWELKWYWLLLLYWLWPPEVRMASFLYLKTSKLLNAGWKDYFIEKHFSPRTCDTYCQSPYNTLNSSEVYSQHLWIIRNFQIIFISSMEFGSSHKCFRLVFWTTPSAWFSTPLASTALSVHLRSTTNLYSEWRIWIALNFSRCLLLVKTLRE